MMHTQGHIAAISPREYRSDATDRQNRDRIVTDSQAQVCGFSQLSGIELISPSQQSNLFKTADKERAGVPSI